MSDENRREDSTEARGDSEIEIEIDTDLIEDEESQRVIDEAMRDALDAVEHVRARGPAAAPSGVVPVAGADADGGEDVEALRAEIADLKDRSVRTLADFDNFRKRVERERREERRYSGADLLRDLLGVVDNLERAFDSAGSVDDLKEGVKLILRQLEELLRVQGVKTVKPTGDRFDPALHDAVSQVVSEEVQVPTVETVLQNGYLLHDRLLRPAMVVVAMPADKSNSAVAGEDAEGGGD